jgi:hypothetical protein
VIAQLALFAPVTAQVEPDEEVWVHLGPYSDPPGTLDYEVSSHGRIRSPKGIRSLDHWDKRVKINFSLRRECTAFGNRACPAKGRPRWHLVVPVHVIVCWVFHGPRPPGHQCDHIDGDRTNNRASNLRWVPPEANCANKAWRQHCRRWQ